MVFHGGGVTQAHHLTRCSSGLSDGVLRARCRFRTLTLFILLSVHLNSLRYILVDHVSVGLVMAQFNIQRILHIMVVHLAGLLIILVIPIGHIVRAIDGSLGALVLILLTVADTVLCEVPLQHILLILVALVYFRLT